MEREREGGREREVERGGGRRGGADTLKARESERETHIETEAAMR